VRYHNGKDQSPRVRHLENYKTTTDVNTTMHLSVAKQGGLSSNGLYTCYSLNKNFFTSARLNERYTCTCLHETSESPLLIIVPSVKQYNETHFSNFSFAFTTLCLRAEALDTLRWFKAGLLYSGGSCFGPWPRQRLFWQVILSCNWVEDRTSQMTLHAPPYTSFAIHCYFLIFKTPYSVSYWQCR
jgi:hypothetical protein